MAEYPNIAATSFGTSGPVTVDREAFNAVPGSANNIGGSGPEWANLYRDELNALISYRNGLLAEQSRSATAQNALALRQVDAQIDQFNRQLFFNEQAQRAQEGQAAAALAQEGNIAERNRQTQQMLGNYGLANDAIKIAQTEALARQGLALQGYTAADASQLAWRGQEATDLGQGQQAELARRAQEIGQTQFGAQTELARRQQRQGETEFGAQTELARRAALQGETEFGAQTELQRRAALQGELSGAQQMELARRQQIASEALQRAQLQASLRGSSNAFKQLETNLGLGEAGVAPLAAILGGEAPAARYQGLQAPPEAATLATLARDQGAPLGSYGAPAVQPFSTPLQMGGGFRAPTGVGTNFVAPTGLAGGFASPTALQGGFSLPLTTAPVGPAGARPGQAGLLQVAGQNASYNPGDSRTYADALDRVSSSMITAGEGVLGSEYGPSSTVGSKITAGYQQLLREAGTDYLPADDPRVIGLWRRVTNMTENQARLAAHYGEDYFRTYGAPMDGSMLNEMTGQIMAGQPPDANAWSDRAKAKIPGYGTPQFKPPPRAWTGQPTATPGQPTATPGQAPTAPAMPPPPPTAPGGAVPWDAAGPRQTGQPVLQRAAQAVGQPAMQRAMGSAAVGGGIPGPWVPGAPVPPPPPPPTPTGMTAPDPLRQRAA
jgi:hypothetical protein